MSGTIPPRPDSNQEVNTVLLFRTLLKQLIRLSVSVDLLKGTLFALASKIESDPHFVTKLRAAFEVDLELRVRQSEQPLSDLSDRATWRELLELLEKIAAPET